MDTVDIAVVGGGIVGALVAREAAAAFPDADIAVLERGLIGQGASARSAGVHFPRGATERVRAMTEHSERYWTEAALELGLPIHRVDATVVADRSAEEIETTYLRLGEPADPPRGGSPTARAWRLPGCHYADVEGVARRVLTSLRDRIRVWEGSGVERLDSEGEHRLALGHGTELLARRVVLAPGPWIGHPAWAELLAPLGLRVKKIVAAHIEAPLDSEAALTVFHDEDAFLLPLRHRGHHLFSYTCDQWDVEPDALPPALAPEDLADARAVLGRHAPELAERCVSGRVFCDAYSPRREPVVAEVRPGVVFAGAAGGSGYRLAPAIADQTVTALTTANTPAHL